MIGNVGDPDHEVLLHLNDISKSLIPLIKVEICHLSSVANAIQSKLAFQSSAIAMISPSPL